MLTAEPNGRVRPRWVEFVLRPLGSGSHRGDRATVAFGVAALFTGIAGDFWRNLLGWWGFGIVVGLLLADSIWQFARTRPLPRLVHYPIPLLLFSGWCLVTVLWSQYRPETLLGWAVQAVTIVIGASLAISLTKPMLLRALSLAARIVVAMSLAFELMVAIWFPRGVLPLYMLQPGVLEQLTGIPGAGVDQAPGAFFWSQGFLFHGAAIQGINGNRNLLAMAALLALIAIGVQWYAGQLGRWHALAWGTVSLGTMLLCRSMTAMAALAIVACAAVLVAVARPLTNRRRWGLYLLVGALMLVTAGIIVRFNAEIFGLINRSSDMSGRGDIWWEVSRIASEQPITGIGWISYWAPWVEPYKGLLVIDGVQYLQAHNAYIDAWMQTGLIGAGVLVLLVLSTLVRTWWLAIDRGPYRDQPIPTTAVLGFLVMVALTVQSVTESRLLIEGNWLLLCILAISSKLRIQDLPALPRRTLPAHTGPITIVDRRTLEPLELPPETMEQPRVRPPWAAPPRPPTS